MMMLFFYLNTPLTTLQVWNFVNNVHFYSKSLLLSSSNYKSGDQIETEHQVKNTEEVFFSSATVVN